MIELLWQFLGLVCQFDFTFESHWTPDTTNSLANAASQFQYQHLFDLTPYLCWKPSPKHFCLNHIPLPFVSWPISVLH